MKKTDLIPPVITRYLYRRSGLASNTWSGDYASWEEALKHSDGYDGLEIMERVKAATLKVKNGEAAFERDSVLFDRIEYNWPLLASLLWAAAQQEGVLNVLDFGGSLGSAYFQNRKFTAGLNKTRWNVVEQEHMVECGNELFRNEELIFYASIENCVKAEHPTVFLFSSVLQYLRNPYETIESAMESRPMFIIVDNTPFLEKGNDRITIQKVNPKIYKASYPCWFFNQGRFLDFFRALYTNVAEFESDSSVRPGGDQVAYHGFLFRRR